MKPFYVIKAHNQFKSNKYQRGVVLIVTLVFLIALTAVAVALMQNSSSDVRMSGASEEKVIATQEAISALDEVIADQLGGAVGTNSFAFPSVLYPIVGLENNLTAALQPNTVASISLANNPNIPLTEVVDCPRGSGSSTNIIKCKVLRTQVIKTYGRANASGVLTNTIIVNAGIAQEVINYK